MDTLPNSMRLLLSSGRLSKQSVQSLPSLLILRHADRLAIPSHCIVGTELPLTRDGQAKARQLGDCLKSRGILPGAVLMSSSMTRTTQTLLSICSGANWQDRIEDIQISNRALGQGLMFDNGFSLETLRGLGKANPKSTGSEPMQLFNGVLSNKIDIKGIKPFTEGAVAHLNFLKGLLDQQKEQTEPIGLSVLVAHDSNVLYLLAYCFGIKEFTMDTWPPFLDGILLQLSTDDENAMIVSYGEQSIEVKIPPVTCENSI